MFFPNFTCPKRVKDDNPVVEDQDKDEENEEQNAIDEQDSRGSSSDEESSSDDDAESKEDGKVATAEDGHQLSAYELQCLECIRRNKEYLASWTTKAKPISYSKNPTPRWQTATSGVW